MPGYILRFRRRSLTAQIAAALNWILQTGVWNDGGVWDDSATWNDG